MTLFRTNSWRGALALSAGLLLGLACCRPASPPEASPPSASAPVAVVSSAPTEVRAAPLRPADVDAMVRALWQKEGLTPTPGVDDARYLRRVSIDLLGVIPTPEEVEKFLADPGADKRERLVDAMLADARFVDHWTNYWDRVLLGRQVRAAQVDRAEFRGWLHQKIAAGTPWNQMVQELVTATGQNRPDEGNEEKVNGAVNWLLKYRDSPADLTGATSRIFLGVQIQCAQCHDHKTEKWKVDDFRHLAACFMQTRAELVERDGKQRRFEVSDTQAVPKQRKKNPMVAEYATAAPVGLDGTDFSSEPNRRRGLANWMTSPQNPWFARAIVNRLWGHFLGRGIVEPVDDFRDTNPPVAPELLTRLADDLVAQGYDLRRTMRLMALSEAYQRAAGPRSSDKPGEGRLWTRYRMAPLGPDELLASLITATHIDALLARGKEQDLDRVRQQMRAQFSFLFEVDEEEDSNEDFDGTIAQALMLLNGRLTNAGVVSAEGTALRDVLALPTDDARIRSLYLRTLSREPTPAEVTRWRAFLDAPREVVVSEPAPNQDGKMAGKGKKMPKRDPLAALDRKPPRPVGQDATRRQAYEDMFWALLNSSEFTFNH